MHVACNALKTRVKSSPLAFCNPIAFSAKMILNSSSSGAIPKMTEADTEAKIPSMLQSSGRSK